MTLKTSCHNCGINIEHDDWMIGQEAQCPDCGQTILLAPKKETQSPPPKELPELKTKQVSAAQMHLELIRDNSCYKQLRQVIDVVYIIGFVAAIIGLLIGVLNGRATILNGDGGGWIDVLLSIVSAIGAIIFLVAGRQAALLAVDIADTLLHEHSQSKP